MGISFRNETDKPLRFLLYKQRYIPHPDPEMRPYAVFGNTNDIEERIYDNMENVFVRDLLPVDERFDMNMHILSFAPGGCHPFVETHVQEHGAYLYEGEGVYLLNDDWIPVKAEDFIWMGAYCKQCCYGVGRTRLSYIYSKDCHRDAGIDAGGPPPETRRAVPFHDTAAIQGSATMTISASLKPLDLRDELEATNMKGKTDLPLDDHSKGRNSGISGRGDVEDIYPEDVQVEIGKAITAREGTDAAIIACGEMVYPSLKAAELLEPYSKNQIPLLANKLLYTLFFQPSTRTRCSHEVAMHRLGGRVITETDPMGHSAMAKNESLYDGIRVISQYADVLVLRHGDSEQVLSTLERLGSDSCPIISGGYGHVTHPTQGLLDMYTALRALKKPFEDMRIIISTPDLSRARSGQSFALGAARMGAHIIYTGSSELRTPQVQLDKLRSMGASFSPIIICISNDPEYIKKKTGRVVGIMHSLPRNDFEFEQRIDKSEFELYFKQIGFSIPLRMALLASICGVN